MFREAVLNRVEDTAEWATDKKMKGVAAVTDEQKASRALLKADNIWRIKVELWQFWDEETFNEEMRKYKAWAAEKFPGHLEKSAGGGSSSKGKQKRVEQTHPKAPQNKIAKIAKRNWSAGAMKLWNGSNLTESQVSQGEGFLATYSLNVTQLLESAGGTADVDEQAEAYKQRWC